MNVLTIIIYILVSNFGFTIGTICQQGVSLNVEYDAWNYTQSVQLFNTEHVQNIVADSGLTGANISACQEGTISNTFLTHILRSVNYFRLASGINVVSFDCELNRIAQLGALILAANNRLTHYPTLDYKCYFTDGAIALGSSNIGAGSSFTNTILAYVIDNGGGNYAVGHRRWILFPPTSTFGFGYITNSGNTPFNALLVFGESNNPNTNMAIISYPPLGYWSASLYASRWSVGIDNADFTNSFVKVSRNKNEMTILMEPQEQYYGLNTLVWKYFNDTVPSTGITRFTVEINNITIIKNPRNSLPKMFRYSTLIWGNDVFCQWTIDIGTCYYDYRYIDYYCHCGNESLCNLVSPKPLSYYEACNNSINQVWIMLNVSLYKFSENTFISTLSSIGLHVDIASIVSRDKFMEIGLYANSTNTNSIKQLITLNKSLIESLLGYTITLISNGSIQSTTKPTTKPTTKSTTTKPTTTKSTTTSTRSITKIVPTCEPCICSSISYDIYTNANKHQIYNVFAPRKHTCGSIRMQRWYNL